MNENLKLAINHLISQVKCYESYVWNSVERRVTHTEAEEAAALLIYNHLFSRDGIAFIDSADVGYAVETVRQTEGAKEMRTALEDEIRNFLGLD